jgi:AcrR family transcriptional regulator
MIETIYHTRKDQILGIAGKLFRQNGYPATSMRQLASEVGIEPASIYSHIKSKEELLKELCFAMADRFLSTVGESISAADAPETQLRKAMLAHIEVIISNIDAAAVFFHDWRHLSGEDLTRFRVLRHQYEGFYLNIIRDGMEKGIFRSADEKFIMLTLFSAMNWTYEWYKPNSGITAEEIAANLSNIILNGIINHQTAIHNS